MRKKGEKWQILFSWAPKSLWTLTAATKLKHTCSLEGRKAMKNLHNVLKTRTHFASEVCSVEAVVFPVILCRCEIWTIRKDECQRTELLNCGAWEDSWECFIQQGVQTSQSERKSTSDPGILVEGSTEGLQMEKTDVSTAKVPNHGSSKQIVCSSTPGGSSERLKALCTLGLSIHALHSPQQNWRPRKGHCVPWRRGMVQGSTGATTYQVRLERTEQAYMAESWCLGCGNKRKPASHEVPHPKSPEREAQQ